MDFISKLILNHVLHQPAVLAGLAALLANLDRLIKFLLKFFSVQQIDGAIDEIDAEAKAEVDKDAKEQ